MANVDDFEITLDGRPYNPVGYENVKSDDRDPVKKVIHKLFNFHLVGASATNDSPVEICIDAAYHHGQVVVNAFGYQTNINIVRLIGAFDDMACVRDVAVNFQLTSFKKNMGGIRVYVQTAEARRDSTYADGMLQRSRAGRKRRRVDDSEAGGEAPSLISASVAAPLVELASPIEISTSSANHGAVRDDGGGAGESQPSERPAIPNPPPMPVRHQPARGVRSKSIFSSIISFATGERSGYASD